MLEYIQQVFNDKKTFAIFMVTLVVAMFVVLFFIWKPQEELQEFAKYQEINLEEKYKEIGATYLNELIIKFKYIQKEEILSKISSGYLNYVEKTKDELSYELFSKKVERFDGLQINANGEFVVYTTNIIYEDNTIKSMNLLEEEPYSYTIAFDDFCSYKGTYVNHDSENIEFKIKKEYNGITKVGYEFVITNKNNSNISLDTSVNRNIYLVLDNGQNYYLTDIVASNELQDISSGTTVNKTLEFLIPFSLQGNVENIVFKNVKIGNSVKDIEIEI